VSINHTWITGRPNVPEISDDSLRENLSRLRPLVQRGQKFYEVELPDLRGTALTWEPKLIREVEFHPLVHTETDHTCGYHGFFKPSIAEVLAQVPDDLPPEVNAFCILTEQTIGIYETGTGHRAQTAFGHVAP
jgi:hypothetical protein